MVKKIVNNNLEEAVKNKYAVLDFSATWCNPCKMLAPVLEEVSGEYDNVEFYGIDVDENHSLAVQFGIVNIPTLVILKDGQPVSQNVGFVPKAALKQFIDETVNR